MKNLLVAIATLAAIGAARADSPFSDSSRLIANALAQGRTIQGQGRYGDRAMAVPYRLPGDECVNIGLISLTQVSVQHWRYCNGTLESLSGFLPIFSPNSNSAIAEAIARAKQRAARSGQILVDSGDHRILARRVSEETESRGCWKVEVLVLKGDRLLSRNLDAACVQAAPEGAPETRE